MNIYDTSFNNNVYTESMAVSQNAYLEKMMVTPDCYLVEKTHMILSGLESAQLYQFCDSSGEGQRAPYKMLTVTQQINNRPMKLVTLFTNAVAINDIARSGKIQPSISLEQNYNFMCAHGIFSGVCRSVLNESALDGIVVNPGKENYVIAKNVLFQWNEYKMIKRSSQLLKTIDEKISDQDAELTDDFIDVVFMLRDVWLPMPILKQPDGREGIHVSMITGEYGETWVWLSTSKVELQKHMFADGVNFTSIKYIPNTLSVLATEVLSNNYAGIVVNSNGKEFKIESKVCELILKDRSSK